VITKDGVNTTGTGYKVFYTYYNDLRSVAMWNNKTYKQNVWEHCGRVYPKIGHLKYKKGFHVFLNKEDAIKYQNIINYCKAYKVLYRKGYTLGSQRFKMYNRAPANYCNNDTFWADVVVAREMKILDKI